MKVAFQIDRNIQFDTDTTFLLIKEAHNRGHDIVIYYPEDIGLLLNNPIALAKNIILYDSHFTIKNDIMIHLNEIDIIFIRQNPPLDMRYITTTYILEKTSTLVINNPKEIRNSPEKLITSLFPTLIPPTLVTENLSMIKDFYSLYQDIIIKPLYNYGGRDVIRIQDDQNINVLVELMISKYACPIIIQAFCANIETDKRILLLDGDPIGVIKRVPRVSREIRTNIRLNASCEPSELNEIDKEICRTIGPELKKRGLLFVGIDIINNFLLEINTTSPTGIVHFNKLYNIALEKVLWDCFEQKVQLHNQNISKINAINISH
ncbi:glutathione synthase [Wolbachia endosymbiont of Howardula sp.]|uniref:glutathione synthase n=1 Tax=Wolbachia endosymbiont of Howardula sp. TaxID=2916816 RepID=UPI00217D0457|nr:glutathione synthase [Wolbachia endosymbiont of Howardula sp.]UWI83355.1 glutathione synthase [Wolbachia endosymbiont of Howardula sp.]